MTQYCIYNRDDKFLEVAEWVSNKKIKCELHLNRTRFWVPEGIIMTEFLLKYSEICPKVNEEQAGGYVIC
jgi:hypothetical protein